MNRATRATVIFLAGLFSLWLALHPKGEAGSLDRVLHVIGVFGVMAMVNIVIGYLCGLVAIRRHWSPFRCRLVGLPLLVIGAFGLIHLLNDNSNQWLFGLMAFSTLAGQVCRKMAYPEVGWMESDPEHHSDGLR